MDDVYIRVLDRPALKNPILVEGLPGVGNVGKLAADYLKEKLQAKPLATFYSKFFPPQVYVSEEGLIRLVSNDLSQGRVVEKPRVLGAATNTTLVDVMKRYGVVFSRNDPGGGLIGASGLFLGLGRLFGMEGVCLMGETSGYFVDPRSAEAVLKVLMRVLAVELDFSDLEAKAREIDRIAQKIHEAEQQKPPEAPPASREDLGYIG